MSFVVAVMKKDYAIVAGDTQLNNENGKISATGIKVFPVDNNTVIGLVGDYKGHLSFFDKLRNLTIIPREFDEKTRIINDMLKECCNDFNGILVTVDTNGTRYSVFCSSGKLISKTVDNGGEVKVLIPPDIEEEYCYPYITSLDNIKQQVVNCIKAVGKVSASVNETAFGFKLSKNGISHFTDGIDYDSITVRICGL